METIDNLSSTLHVGLCLANNESDIDPKDRKICSQAKEIFVKIREEIEQLSPNKIQKKHFKIWKSDLHQLSNLVGNNLSSDILISSFSIENDIQMMPLEKRKKCFDYLKSQLGELIENLETSKPLFTVANIAFFMYLTSSLSKGDDVCPDSFLFCSQNTSNSDLKYSKILPKVQAIFVKIKQQLAQFSSDKIEKEQLKSLQSDLHQLLALFEKVNPSIVNDSINYLLFESTSLKDAIETISLEERKKSLDMFKKHLTDCIKRLENNQSIITPGKIALLLVEIQKLSSGQSLSQL